MMRGQEYLRGIVPINEFDECYRWAFGDDVESLQIHNSHRVWNQRQSDLFTIECNDAVKETTIKIGKAYMESKKVKSREVLTQGAA